MKKGYILGKGYVTNGPDYCVVIGSAGIDIGGMPHDALVESTVNVLEIYNMLKCFKFF